MSFMLYGQHLEILTKSHHIPYMMKKIMSKEVLILSFCYNLLQYLIVELCNQRKHGNEIGTSKNEE